MLNYLALLRVKVVRLWRAFVWALINAIYHLGVFLKRLLIGTLVAATIVFAIGFTSIQLYKRYQPQPVQSETVTRVFRVVDESRALPSDERLLAATMYGEARGEGIEGMRAVGHVVVNRLNSHAYGDTLSAVVFYPYQFSAWNSTDINSEMLQRLDAHPPTGRDLEIWMIAQALARDILDGRSIDPTRGAQFYHTTAINPYWARPASATITLGAHIFYTRAG